MNEILRNNLKEKIGRCVYTKREDNGYSRNEFLDLINISLNSLSLIENGDTLVKLDTLIEITNALGISLESFFGSLEM